MAHWWATGGFWWAMAPFRVRHWVGHGPLVGNRRFLVGHGTISHFGMFKFTERW